MDPLPQELIEAIVNELDDASLYPFCLLASFCVGPSQARIFRSLQIRVEGPSSTSRVKDHRPMSPWQAERLFSASPHLALYVQRLWLDIPPPKRPLNPRVVHIPARPTDCYPPLQKILPAFTRVRRLLVSAPADRRWTQLPGALKDAIHTIVSLASLNELHFHSLSIPATLITSVAACVPALTLTSVVIEYTGLHTAPPAQAQALRELTIQNTSKAMSDLLGAPGVIPSLPELSIQYPAEWAHVFKIIQGRAATLKRLRFRLNRRFGEALLVPCLSALRVLELETSIGDPPYRLPDTFIALLSQIPNAMPRLELAGIRATISVFVRRSRFDLLALGEPEDVNDVAWTHSGPLDLGTRATAHCQLCFQDFPPFDLSEELWELREAVYREFVRCMGELMPAVCDRGGLSFSQTRIYLGPLSVKKSLGGPILKDLLERG